MLYSAAMCTSHDVKLEDIWHVLENIDPLKIPEEGKSTWRIA